MALWTAGILLVLGLVWFVGAVVVPVWKTREVVRETAISSGAAREAALHWEGAKTGWVDMEWWIDPDAECKKRACRLGGQKRAAWLLSLYISMPDKWATNKETAIMLLSSCGKNAVPALEAAAAGDTEEGVREAARKALEKIRAQKEQPKQPLRGEEAGK
jgi:hypothetical protein